MHPVAPRLDTIQRRSSNSSCEAPAEEKLFCSCSSLSASVVLMMQPGVPVTVIETATAADLCYSLVRPVRVVAVTSSDLCHSEKSELNCVRFAKWLRGAARNALAAEGRPTEFFHRRPYLTSRRRRSRCAAPRPRHRPTNEATCRRVKSSSFRGKSCRQGSSEVK